MKKINLVLVLALVLISCGGKSSENKEDVNSASSNDCNCNELNLPEIDQWSSENLNSLRDDWKNILKDGKLYSGSCIEKDQNDSIIMRLNFKNGYTTRKIIREKISAIYVTVIDINYDNLKEKDGFKIKFETDENLKYVSTLTVIKEGKIDEKESYRILLKKSAVIAINERLDYDTDQFIWDSADGLSFRFTKNIENKVSKYLQNLTNVNNNEITKDSEKKEYEYYIENASAKQTVDLLEYLKNNVPKFNYVDL